MNKAELTNERLQEMVENLTRQTAKEPADDLYNKMGILRGYLIKYADEQSREKCDSCMFTYHNKANKGFHDVEEFYQEGE